MLKCIKWGGFAGRETYIPGTRGHLRLEEGVSAGARGGARSVLELETNIRDV